MASVPQPDVTEVGWAFVDQYYTFVNRDPNKLHLFYTTSSTLCHGVEGEMVPTYRGQSQIQQRIREHGFQDCRVMVSNVDCQPSAQGGVVVQVLGEMANAGRPAQKFAQTFVLAPQPAGYFVLNDILRFLKEDVVAEDEGVDESLFSQNIGDYVKANGHDKEYKDWSETNGDAQAPVAPAQNQAPVPAPAQSQATSAPVSVPATANAQSDANAAPATAAVATAATAPATAPAGPAAAATTASAPVSAPATAQTPAAPQPSQSSAVPAASAAPSVAPASTGTATATKAPAAAATPTAAPTGPLSWADKIALNAAKDGAKAKESKPAAAATAPAVPAATSGPSASSSQSPVAPSAAPASASGKGSRQKKVEYHSAYIKYVTHKVDDNLLRQALENIGKLSHFQVEKSKQCAFVDFIDEPTLKSALAVHELQVGDQVVLIEERKRGGAKKNTGSTKSRNGGKKKV